MEETIFVNPPREYISPSWARKMKKWDQYSCYKKRAFLGLKKRDQKWPFARKPQNTFLFILIVSMYSQAEPWKLKSVAHA